MWDLNMPASLSWTNRSRYLPMMLRQLKWHNLHVRFFLLVNTAKQIVMLFLCQNPEQEYQPTIIIQKWDIHHLPSLWATTRRAFTMIYLCIGGMLLEVPAVLQCTSNMLLSARWSFTSGSWCDSCRDFTVRHSSDRGMVGVFTCGRGVVEIKYLSNNVMVYVVVSCVVALSCWSGCYVDLINWSDHFDITLGSKIKMSNRWNDSLKNKSAV